MFEFGLKSWSSWEGGCYLVRTCRCFSVRAGTIGRLPLRNTWHSTVPTLTFCNQALSRLRQRNITLDVATVFQWWHLCLAGIIFCKSDNYSPVSYGCKSKDNFILGSLTFPYSDLLSWEQHAFQLEKSPNTSALCGWTSRVGSASPVLGILFLSSGSLSWPSQHPPLLTEPCCFVLLQN